MRRRVVVVGGGFGGISAARTLDPARFDVTLIDRCNYHLFQPLLYQVATGSMAASDIATPLRMMFSPKHVRVVKDEVVRVDVETRRVHGGSGLVYPWDTLILALGLGHSYFGHDEWARHAPSLKFLEDGFAIRARVLDALERAELAADDAERRRLLRFVVVGAGPTGVELAGAIGELTGRTLAREFRSFDPRQAEILLVEGGPRILPQFSERAADRAVPQLERLGVRVLTGHNVVRVDAGGVVLDDGSGERLLEAGNVIWAAGAEATPFGRALAERLGAPGAGGRVRVDRDFRVEGRDDVFVVGDLADFRDEGFRLPGLAPAAKQAGRHVARLLNGRQEPFRYRNRGHLAVIGSNAAVGAIGRLELSGPIAWWAWLLVHIQGLIGFDVKLKVLIVWAWKFAFNKYGARLITTEGAARWSRSPH